MNTDLYQLSVIAPSLSLTNYEFADSLPVDLRAILADERDSDPSLEGLLEHKDPSPRPLVVVDRNRDVLARRTQLADLKVSQHVNTGIGVGGAMTTSKFKPQNFLPTKF